MLLILEISGSCNFDRSMALPFVREAFRCVVPPPAFRSTLQSADEGSPNERSETFAQTTSASVLLSAVLVCFLLNALSGK